MRAPHLSRSLGRLFEAEAIGEADPEERARLLGISDELFEDALRTEHLERDPQANETNWEDYR